MSSTVVVGIPSGIIEAAIRSTLDLEEPVSLWGAVWDEVGLNVGFVIEVDSVDLDKLGLSEVDVHFLENGEQLQ